MDPGAGLLDLLGGRGPRGVDPVAEEHRDKLPLGIDPEAGAGEAEVTEAAPVEERPRGGAALALAVKARAEGASRTRL